MTSGLHDALAAHGLAILGHCSALSEDALPELPGGEEARSIALVVNAGSAIWPHFTASEEYSDGEPDPLNRWSARILGAIADAHGAGILLPFEGPPYWPFQRWALRTGLVSRSPIGILAHRNWGLWFAFRAAFLLPDEVKPHPPDGGPCEDCPDKPCLDACPACALTREHDYRPPLCRDHVGGPGRDTCGQGGCLVRHACPYGAGTAYLPQQAAFHMAAFTR